MVILIFDETVKKINSTISLTYFRVPPSGNTWIPFFCWLLFCVVELLSPGNLGPSVLEVVLPDVFKF